ncbi:MAG: class I SAM-dependent methyltransferase [Solirubrobacterales bacterium]
MTGTKTPYLGELTSKLPPGARILDYGCGIGSDGLALLEAGYEVEFADFDNPSTRYLRWRLARRGLDVPVHDLDAGVPGGFDGAYAFDVLEHLTDPVAVLEQIEQRTALVCVNLLEPAEDEPAVHHTLPIGGLLRRIARFELVGYRIYHGRSHLLTYRPVVARGAALLASRARLVAGRARRGGAALGSRRG